MRPIHRREFALSALLSTRIQAAPTVPRPTPAQAAWQDFELGIVFHFDMPVFEPGGWKDYKQAFDPNLYQPRKLDTGQWLAAAKEMGCRYAIFTATHFNGFLQWQSDLYPYGLKQTSWRGGKADIFGDFVKSCHQAGIAPGVYLSCHRNAFQKVWNHRVDWGAGGAGQDAFARLGERMTEELVSRYGPLCEIWYDAGLLHPEQGGPNVVPIVDRHQKSTVFYHSPQRRQHRWIGNESGFAGDPCWATMPDLAAAERAHQQSGPNRRMLLHGDPAGSLWSPAMVDVPIRNHEWFWRPNDDRKVYAPEAMVDMYYKSVGLNCNLIFGGTPDLDGLIPEADFRSYAAFGREIRRRFAKPLAETKGRGNTVTLALKKPARIDHVSIMETITEGERIRAYTVEAHTGAGQWSTLCSGESVGHKRIHKFTPVEAAAVRLTVAKSTAEPLIRSLAVYST
ncbi:MAG: alpha-L-fucosidase [Acidobacteria bacterium]|nr:alpha-L-fucosidase [Acidobacteriota bacterium]